MDKEKLDTKATKQGTSVTTGGAINQSSFSSSFSSSKQQQQQQQQQQQLFQTDDINYDPIATQENDNNNTTTDEVNSKKAKNKIQQLDLDDDNNNLSDEFNDDDLDERAEEFADEASHRIRLSRLLEYALKIIRNRLGLCSTPTTTTTTTPTTTTTTHISSQSLLPIPMSQTRLIEVLGSVTMVCFIDDDIICENFSVTEEIFLLQTSSETTEVKTKVLDLHANPEAKGSRFENPQWFTYLPSLKPIGLNAMLTYCPFPPQNYNLTNLPERYIQYIR